jgi:flagellar assembly protein FliH
VAALAAVEPEAMTASVLRDAGPAGRPRVLGRQGAAPVAEAVVATVAPVRDDRDITAAIEQAHRDGLARGHESGLREGRAQGMATASQDELQAGFDAGLQRGLAEGRAQAADEAQRHLQALRAEAASRLQRIDALQAAWAQQLREQLAQRLAAAEEDMVALCHEVLCRVFGAAALDPRMTAQSVRVSVAGWLEATGAQAVPLTVRVHPDDLESLQSDADLSGWLERQGLRGVHWQPDPEVAWGGCILRSPQGLLDARLETQFAAVHASMRERHDG